MHQLSDLWWRLLINRTDGTLRAGRQGWIFTPHELRPTEMTAALAGQQSLGVYAVSKVGYSRWLCLDADTVAGRDQLITIAERLNPSTSLFEISRRGAHLWWFCPPTAWHLVQRVGQSLVGENAEGIEIFPKGRGRNGVRVPLTPHPRTGQIYPVVDPISGEIKTLSQLRQLYPEPLPRVELAHEVAPRAIDAKHQQQAFAQLADEVQRFTQLRQYGPERAIGRCPFHDDHRPSLSLVGGFWRCWAGCGEGGLTAFHHLVQKRGLR